MDRYSYTGPVKVFNTIVNPNWHSETKATTPERAKSNLAYQWKMANGLVASSKVELPGKLTIMESPYGRRYY